jgi:hypothetical protein
VSKRRILANPPATMVDLSGVMASTFTCCKGSAPGQRRKPTNSKQEAAATLPTACVGRCGGRSHCPRARGGFGCRSRPWPAGTRSRPRPRCCCSWSLDTTPPYENATPPYANATPPYASEFYKILRPVRKVYDLVLARKLTSGLAAFLSKQSSRHTTAQCSVSRRADLSLLTASLPSRRSRCHAQGQPGPRQARRCRCARVGEEGGVYLC